jgi:hypothetical protein
MRYETAYEREGSVDRVKFLQSAWIRSGLKMFALGFSVLVLQAWLPVWQADANSLGVTELVAFPNPASTFATIRFTTAAGTDSVKIVIYDTKGRVVRRLENGPAAAGVRTDVFWELGTDNGSPVANGIYLVKVTTNGTHGEVVDRIKIAVVR